MPISVSCPLCFAKFDVPDIRIGKRTDCPRCGENFPVLAPEMLGPGASQPAGDATTGEITIAPLSATRPAELKKGGGPYGSSGTPAAPGQPAPLLRSCPFCGETISAAVTQCKHCGAALTAG